MNEYTAFICDICEKNLNLAGYDTRPARLENRERQKARCDHCRKVRDDTHKITIRRRQK